MTLAFLSTSAPRPAGAQDRPSQPTEKRAEPEGAGTKQELKDAFVGADPNDAEITLKVTDDAQRPVPKVKVWLEKDYPSFPLCLADGSRRMAVVHTRDDGTAKVKFPAAPTNVIVSHKGYAPLFLRAADLTKQSPYPIRLGAGRTITGRVVDGEKLPLADVAVTARSQNDRSLELLDNYALEGKTDARGKFELPHAAEGSYLVTAHIQDDAVPSYAEPVQVKVVSDGDAPAPLTLVARPGATLRGRLATLHNVPLADREVLAYTRLPKRTQWRTMTAADGSFVVHGIPAGSKGAVVVYGPRDFSLHIDTGAPAGARPFFKVRANAVQFDNVPPGVYDGVTVNVLKEAQATGVVTDDQGKPFEDVHVHVKETSYLFKTDAQGKYTAKIPPNQDVTLVVSRSGEVDLGAQPEVKVRAGEGQAVVANLKAIRRNLAVPENALTGRVLRPDGSPAAAVQVYLSNHGVLPQHVMNAGSGRPGKVPKPKWTGGTFYPASTKTDEQGRFTFDMLDVGTTDLWAVDPKAGWAVAQELGTNAKDLQLKLAPRGKDVAIDGSVVGPGGEPAAGRRVVLLNGDHNRPAILKEGKTDEQGRFSLRAVPPEDSSFKHLRIVCPPPAGADGSPSGGAVAWKTVPRCSLSGVKIQLQPEATLNGRAVNGRGEPVAGAVVRLYLGRNPKHGEMFFFRATESLGPRTTTGPDGIYALRGLPADGNVSVQVNHADYGQGEAWYVTDYAAGKRAPDVEMPDGIVIEGTVRYAGTNRPAAGAKVSINTGVSDESAGGATADEQGRYRLRGLDRWVFSRGRFVVGAKLGARAGADEPEWEGQAVREGDLYAGDALADVDVVLDRSFASRFGEWLEQPGEPAPTRSRVVVIEDADPAAEGKDRYGDTLTVYSGGDLRSVSWKYDALNVNKYSRPAVVQNPADGSVWVCEGPDRRVLRFDRDGKLLWEKTGLRAHAMAIHTPTGNAWCLTQEQTIYGKGLLVLDPAGNVVRQSEQPGYDLAYGPPDDSFWVVGQKAQKLDRDGKVVCDSPARFAWLARQVEVDETDGTAWVVDDRHPDVRDSVNRVLLLNPEGRVRKEISLGERGAGPVLLDPARSRAWLPTGDAAGGAALMKFSAAGDVLGEYPVPGSSAALEPDTGYVWLAGPAGIFRVDANGRVVWGERTNATQRAEGGARRWVYVVGQ